ncbi:MAG: sigma-54 dependent transcriptional regulator [Candidatus Omnitrophota bacterium]|nr:sigma-54 dependent transcriptional regulator [Candidatus Omnitrophota bacterium]
MNNPKERNSKIDILVVDDEPLIRESLYEILRIDGYRAYMASSGEEALTLLGRQKIDIVLTDLKLPKMDGLELLTKIKAAHPETEVIMITGYGTIETAVDTMRKGAFDYVTKPVNDNEIKIIIDKIVDKKAIVEENKSLRQLIAQVNRSSLCDMIGSSESMQRVYHVIDSVASSNATILISGESGTGKGLVARAIHSLDQNRKDKPFVEVSCGALSETLLESELFGHVKGAFTGAIKDKEGRFEFARGGTIFLDEIDAFSPNLQVKLLRVLQDGIIERVGDNAPRKADVRIIVATNQSLSDLVSKGKFRGDLYYRINVISIQLPALRERKEDIDVLVRHFLERYSRDNKKKITGIAEDVRKVFLEYHWPGNVRELENAIEGAVIMVKTGIINRWDIPNFGKFESAPAVTSANPDGWPLKKVMEQPEKDLILTVLKDCHWNRNKAAEALGINRTTLYNKMKKYEISFHKPGR